jgi:hypothetical protein
MGLRASKSIINESIIEVLDEWIVVLEHKCPWWGKKFDCWTNCSSWTLTSTGEGLEGLSHGIHG